MTTGGRSLLRLALSLAMTVAGCAQAGAPLGSGPAGSRPTDTMPLCGETPAPGPCRDWAPTPGPSRMPIGSMSDLGGNCHAQLSPDRCQALAFAAARQLAVGFDLITAIDIVPDPSPPPGGIDFGHHVFVEVVLGNVRHVDVAIACLGISAASVPECMREPVVPLAYPGGAAVGGGYTDTPEGATPFPSLDPNAIASAEPLEIASQTIRVADVGRDTIDLGHAKLANGYLREGRFALADPWPANVLFDDWVTLEVTPVDGGAPLRNVYEHAWRQGTEDVDVTLSYDVAWFQSGASFTVVDVVVR